MRIFGIDPGTQVLGYGLIEAAGGRLKFLDCGVVRAPRGAPVPERLLALHRGLAAALAEARPELAALEQAFYGKSVASALRIGEGRGVALQACAAAGLKVIELTPAEVKRAVVGRGGAEKARVARMVGALLGQPGPISPPDAADALAVAIAAAHRARFGQLVEAAEAAKPTRAPDQSR